MSDISLLIYSCKAYSDLWSNHFYLLDKYWPSHPKSYLVSDGFGTFNISKVDGMFVYDKNCSDRLINAIKNITSEYIFITFDDYYLCKKIDDASLNDIISFVTNNGIDSRNLLDFLYFIE